MGPFQTGKVHETKRIRRRSVDANGKSLEKEFQESMISSMINGLVY